MAKTSRASQETPAPKYPAAFPFWERPALGRSGAATEQVPQLEKLGKLVETLIYCITYLCMLVYVLLRPTVNCVEMFSSTEG